MPNHSDTSQRMHSILNCSCHTSCSWDSMTLRCCPQQCTRALTAGTQPGASRQFLVNLHYLPSLQGWSKWRTGKGQLAWGQVVLMADPQLPCALWPVGRIMDIHQGMDGQVKVYSLLPGSFCCLRSATQRINQQASFPSSNVLKTGKSSTS